MTIKYSDGRNNEAVLLSRTDNTICVALKGSDDATHFTEVNGAWFSENGESVQVEFAWQSRSRAAVPAVSDCICSAELASRLVHLLFAGTREVRSAAPQKHFTA